MCVSISGTGFNIEKTYDKYKEKAYVPFQGYESGPFQVQKYVITNTANNNAITINLDFSGKAFFGLGGTQTLLANDYCLDIDCPSTDPKEPHGVCLQDCIRGFFTGTRDGSPINIGYAQVYNPSCYYASYSNNIQEYRQFANWYYSPNNWFVYPARYALAGDSYTYDLEFPSCNPVTMAAGEIKLFLRVLCDLRIGRPTPTPMGSPEPEPTPNYSLPTFTPLPGPPLPEPSEDGYDLWVWGENIGGKLGNGTVESTSSLVQTSMNTKVWTSVSAGYSNMAAIATNGGLYVWGQNTFFQLGTQSIQSTSEPTLINYWQWLSVDCGEQNTAAIKIDNSLWVWGQNAFGQIGNESTEIAIYPTQTVDVSTDWKSVSVGGAHVGAIKTNGSMWLWGCNTTGQLGNADISISCSSPIQTFYETNDWSSIYCGLNYSMAIKKDGTAWVWGANYGGNLGLGNTEPIVSIPTQIKSVAGIWKQLATTLEASGGICDTNSVLTPTPSPSQTPSPSPTPSASLSATPTATPTPTPPVANMNLLYTWGNNNYGKIGNNTQEFLSGVSIPVNISSGSSYWRQVASTKFMNAAIKYDNSLWLWGRNIYGQLGIGNSVNMSSPVQIITGTSDWLQTSASGDGTGAIKTDGTLWLWGQNYGGQLGQNNTVNISSPAQIYGGGSNWAVLSFGIGYNVGALKSDGTFWLWGSNFQGQAGVNLDSNSYSSPVQEITNSSNWVQISLGAYFTSAMKSDGTVWCWGQNYAGTLGDNSSVDKSTPVQEYSASTWLTVSAGVNYVLAIKNDNTLWTWGANYDGQLGISGDLNTPVSVPTQIGTESTWIYADAGDASSFAIKSDGSLWAWGYNSYGELGLGNDIPCSSPIQVPYFTDFWTYAESQSAGIRTMPIPTSTPTPTPT